jgi:protein AIR1/2
VNNNSRLLLTLTSQSSLSHRNLFLHELGIDSQISNSMPDTSGDENDSRNASINPQRRRLSDLSAVSPQSSGDVKIGKTAGRRFRTGRRDVHDFVPQGGIFNASANANLPMTEQPPDNVPEIMNENQVSHSAITTSLSGKMSIDLGGNGSESAFELINGELEGDCGASVLDVNDMNIPDNLSPGGRDQRSSVEAQLETKKSETLYFLDETDDSESGNTSEGDSSIMLNLSSHNESIDYPRPPGDASPLAHPTQGSELQSSPIHDPIDEQTISKTHNTEDDGNRNTNEQSKTEKSKKDAFHVLSLKYNTPPSILADLDADDLAIQARYFFYHRDIHDIDLKFPISCTECLQEGHLAITCPSKEVCLFNSQQDHVTLGSSSSGVANIY